RGIGFSNCIEKAASPGVEGAELRFDRGGTATLFAGSVTTGQGHETAFKQIVCERLGLKFSDVHYVWGDTDKVAFGHGSGGSRSSALGSSAVLLATEKVLAKATKIAARALEVDSGDVAFADGVFSSSKSNKTLTIKDVAKLSLNPKALPDGMEPGLIEQAVHVAKAANYPNGVHACEVEIDEETGKVDIVAYNVVDDVKTLMEGKLAPSIEETHLGTAEVREVFNVSRVGRVAGCRVTDGVVRRGARVRLLRDSVVVYEGELETLKHFKDDVREITNGNECGISLENYNDVQQGDVIECFEVKEVARQL
ncbi:MAG: molybdopterin cofactor-binding domain-containing protein, partial [Alphaproteobacteria bacterium]